MIFRRLTRRFVALPIAAPIALAITATSLLAAGPAFAQEAAAQKGAAQEAGAPAVAQDSATTDPDALFQQARELAFSGRRDQGRDLCYRILEGSPGYHDVRILVGRTYAWDGDYDAGRRELWQVLDVAPDYTDASRALVDLETWAGDYERALEVADQGLSHAPADGELLYKKARILGNLDRVDEAMEVAEHLLQLDPQHSRARALLQSLDLAQIRNEVYAFYRPEGFSDIGAWHQTTVQLTRQFSFGSLSGRANFANRFDSTAGQFEVNAYPRIADGWYAYANYGYSKDSFFPSHRFGGEVYGSLPNAREFSVGFRHLRFSESTVTIYTGSFGWYRGNYWFSVRPYITPGGGTSASLHFQTRRYFRDADNYIGFRIGGGSSPDEVENVIDAARLSSLSLASEWQKGLAPTVLLSISGGYSFEEFSFDRNRHRFWFSGGVTKRF